MISRWRKAGLRAALSVLVLLAGAHPARAQADAGAARALVPQRRVVVLTLVSPGGEPALGDTIRELLARLQVEMSGPAGPDGGEAVPPDAVLVRVQVDLSSPSDAVLLVTDGHTGEVRLRRVVPREGSRAIVREEIAHAVQSAVESQLVAERDRAAALPAPPPPQPPPPLPAAVVAAPPPSPVTREAPRSPPASPSPFALDLVTLAGVGPVANGSGPDARLGGGVVGRWRTNLHPSLALSLTYAPPFDTGSGIVSSHASVVAVRLVPAVEILRVRWFGLDLGAGGGIDLLTVAPRTEQLPVSTLGPQTSRADVVLSAVATAHVVLAAGVLFLLQIAGDVDLSSRRYVLEEGTEEAAVLAPWRVRPTMLAGFAFTALGEPHSAAIGAP